jgi:predicted metalloendopeptidase
MRKTVAILMLAGCGSSSHPKTVPPATAPASSVAAVPTGPKVVDKSLADVGLDEADLDTAIDPCQDFYQFACGGWMKTHEIPPDRGSFGAFEQLREKTLGDVRGLLEDAQKNAGDDKALKMIGDYYGACMDEKSVEAQGLKGLQPLVDTIAKVKDPATLSVAVAQLHAAGVGVLWRLASTQDEKDATSMIAEISQGGLGMPDRDYYLSDDAKKKDVRAAYLTHVGNMLALGGMKADDAKKAAADVLALETELAQAERTRVEMRDPKAVYNRLDRKGVSDAIKAFAWDDYWKTVGLPGASAVNVTTPAALAEISKMAGTIKPATWRAYLTYHLLSSFAQSLPKAFVDEDFTFAKNLSGQQQIQDRWKRCTAATSQALADYVSQPYVKKFFGEDAKQGALFMVHAISDSFADEVKTLDWMDDATKAKAIEKREALAYLIGFPDKWRSYDYAVDAKSYTADSLAARKWNVAYDLGKVGKPVDRGEFGMPAPTINAYYDPSMNHMVFPAGILQPPFFSASWTVPVQLGAMGLVVGHELTHGFDDQGAQFDKDGNLVDWWSKDTEDKFKAKTGCVADQYSKYEPLPGLNINGKLTNGENIADNGGLRLAWRAYRRLRANAPETIRAGGYTEDQQFFLAAARVWCDNMRPEALRTRVATDGHSPDRFRVNGPMSNMPEFGAAWKCAAGTPMNPTDRCQLW